jgi:hypothetical protein
VTERLGQYAQAAEVQVNGAVPIPHRHVHEWYGASRSYLIPRLRPNHNEETSVAPSNLCGDEFEILFLRPFNCLERDG